MAPLGASAVTVFASVSLPWPSYLTADACLGDGAERGSRRRSTRPPPRPLGASALTALSVSRAHRDSASVWRPPPLGHGNPLGLAAAALVDVGGLIEAAPLGQRRPAEDRRRPGDRRPAPGSGSWSTWPAEDRRRPGEKGIPIPWWDTLYRGRIPCYMNESMPRGVYI